MTSSSVCFMGKHQHAKNSSKMEPTVTLVAASPSAQQEDAKAFATISRAFSSITLETAQIQLVSTLSCSIAMIKHMRAEHHSAEYSSDKSSSIMQQQQE